MDQNTATYSARAEKFLKKDLVGFGSVAIGFKKLRRPNTGKKQCCLEFLESY